MEIITKSFEETQKVGFELAQKLKAGDIVCLYGDLGSGKTTFVQGLAKGLGLKQRITSPTFIIVRTYKIKSQISNLKNASKNLKSSFVRSHLARFYHIDLYRIEGSKNLENLSLEEMLNDKEGIVVMEWAEKIKNLLPEKRIDIYFEYLDENRRKLTINPKV